MHGDQGEQISAIAESVSVLNNNVKRGKGEVSGGNINAAGWRYQRRLSQR